MQKAALLAVNRVGFAPFTIPSLTAASHSASLILRPRRVKQWVPVIKSAFPGAPFLSFSRLRTA